MYFFFEKKSQIINHHGDSINPDFAEWVRDFVSNFSENILIIIFISGLLIFLIMYVFILYFSRKK